MFVKLIIPSLYIYIYIHSMISMYIYSILLLVGSPCLLQKASESPFFTTWLFTVGWMQTQRNWRAQAWCSHFSPVFNRGDYINQPAKIVKLYPCFRLNICFFVPFQQQKHDCQWRRIGLKGSSYGPKQIHKWVKNPTLTWWYHWKL